MSEPFGRLRELPRAILAHVPTPIERLDNLSAHVGGASIFVKRDDCTGLALGGNKIRQLEYYFGEAIASGCDTILITGAVQSNFVRSAAAAAAKLGFACHIQLEERVANVTDTYRASGNVLLDKLFGATLHSFPEGENEAAADSHLALLADQLRHEGAKPYIIHLSPGNAPLGALGYIDTAIELNAQLADLPASIDQIFVASGSASTHGGLLFGLRGLACQVPVTGVCVRRTADLQRERVRTRTQEIADYLGCTNAVTLVDLEFTDTHFPPGYGHMNAAVVNAITLAARHEALLVDPVYTGRVVAATIEAARQAPPSANILFIHTGGTPALFAYEPELSAIMTAGYDPAIQGAELENGKLL